MKLLNKVKQFITLVKKCYREAYEEEANETGDTLDG